MEGAFFLIFFLYIFALRKLGKYSNVGCFFIDFGHCRRGNASLLRADFACEGRQVFQQACWSKQGDA